MLVDYRRAVRSFIQNPTDVSLKAMQETRASVYWLDHSSMYVDENRNWATAWVLMPYVSLFVRAHPGCSADDIYSDCRGPDGDEVPDIPMYLALHYLVIAGVLRCDNCFYQVPAMGSHLLYHFWPRRWWQKMWSPRKENTL